MNSRNASTVTSGMIGGAIAGIVLGLILATLSIGFDWSGFPGGLAVGAGVGIALAGAFFWGLGVGLRRGNRSMWLPSEGAVE